MRSKRKGKPVEQNMVQGEMENVPTAVTRPRKVVSPVIAIVGGTDREEKSDTRATVKATPALGPSYKKKDMLAMICLIRNHNIKQLE